MKNLLVLYEIDLEDGEETVIGVADSVENSKKIIKEHYVDYKEIEHNDTRDSSLEYTKVLELKDNNQNLYKVKVCTEWFELNTSI